MDEEYPVQATRGEGQNPGTERIGPGAPAPGQEPRLAPGPPPTGDDRVDAALAGLSRLAGAPAEEHVAVLEEAHGRLRDILGEVNEGSS
jgi:hypothetical protein